MSKFLRSGRTTSIGRRRSMVFIAVAMLSAVALFPRVLSVFPTASALTNGGNITALEVPITENFDTLSNTGTSALTWTDNVTIPGWYSSRTTYTPGTGSSNAGALYSFGSTASTDRALGSVGSSGTGTIYYGVRLTNNTGNTITSLDISYIAEQWRNGGSSNATPSAAQSVDFQYQVANANAITAINTPTTGWLDYDPLDFTSPTFGTTAAATLDGNSAANRAAKSSSLVVTIDSGQEIWLRWKDIDHANNDHGLAIDDFSVTAHNATATTNPSGVAAVPVPNPVTAGSTTLLKVTVTPGTNPTSTGIGVRADLSSISGSATQQLFDDGTNGDATPNDSVFSYLANVDAATTGGTKTLPVTITDAEARTGAAVSISLSVNGIQPTNPTVTGAASPSTLSAGSSTLLTATVTAGTNPVSSSITVTGDLSSIGGAATQPFFDDGTNGDVTAGDKIFSYSALVAANTTSGGKTLLISVVDAQARSASTTIPLTISAPAVPPGTIVISQIYAGGGNAGSKYTNDFIELFNRSNSPVSLNGWSVQYSSNSGNSWTRTTLTGTIQPGGYFLVQEAQGAGGSTPLPSPDNFGTLALGATSGKIALSSNAVALPNGCPTGGSLIDLVGYGSAATCQEGPHPTADLGNTLAALRTHDGCKDTDNNDTDFFVRLPSPRNSSTPINTCPLGDLEPEVYSTTPGDGAASVPLNATITIQFDEPVNVASGWFDISCVSTGTHTATSVGGPNPAAPTIFTLTPDTGFATLEKCTVTVHKDLVNDLDANDPPDFMKRDYVFSFTGGHDPIEHLTMGNPTNAITDINQPLNYLLEKSQYVMSYNRDKSTANWVSWHLDSLWLGSAARQDDFRADDTLPADWYHVQNFDFSGTGFDRGHMCPSADRTSSVLDNSATFLMSNMIPQAPGNNQGPWGSFENYLRTIVGQGNELYIISGPEGIGGKGSVGSSPTSVIDTAGGGHVTVPNKTWKVVIVLPAGDNDVARVANDTRTIAVIMPNDDAIRPDQWQKYLATVDQVEALTGDNFFSNVPDSIQNVIEARLDVQNDTAPVVSGQSITTAEDTAAPITMSATDFNVNNVFTYAVASGPSHGTVSGTGANFIYTPNQDYFGPDSFTFTANDGALDSTPATVNITVTAVNDAPVTSVDSKTTLEDTALNFAATDLSANDSGGPSNESGKSLTVTEVNTASDTHGTVTLMNGTVSYVPTANYFGPASFTYTVCDNGTSNGAADPLCAIGTVNVTIDPVNDAPVLSGVPATANFPELAPFTFKALASDVDVPAQVLVFSLIGAPAGATINPSTGDFSWTPLEAQGGTGTPYNFKVRVSDGTASTDVDISLNVGEVNSAPVLDPLVNQSVYLGTTLTFSAHGTDSDQPAQGLTYTLTGAVPAGLSINGNTGVVTWTPTIAQVGNIYTFNVRVTDNGAGNLFDEKPVSIGVAYTWSGPQSPLHDGGDYETGRTIPVKFSLTGASSGIINAVARLRIFKVVNGVPVMELPISSGDNLFRLTGSDYMFNLDTSPYPAGSYQLQVDMGDGVIRPINITLD